MYIKIYIRSINFMYHMNISKHIKYAFTLAEVHITLGIIGVVAALTLPSLTAKYQSMIFKQQYKKVYNTFSNALLKTYANNGGSYYVCYYLEGAYSVCSERDPVTGACTSFSSTYGYDQNSQCDALFSELKTILKVVKVCDTQSYKNGCIPDMKGYDSVLVDNKGDGGSTSDPDIIGSTSGCSGFRETNIKNNNSSWVLADGTVVGFYSGIPGKIFWVDINGHKKPNKWGHDIFTFSIESDVAQKKVKIKPGGCMSPEKGGQSSTDMFASLYN